MSQWIGSGEMGSQGVRTQMQRGSKPGWGRAVLPETALKRYLKLGGSSRKLKAFPPDLLNICWEVGGRVFC